MSSVASAIHARDLEHRARGSRPTEPSSPFLTGVKIIKMNSKNILRSIRQSFEWIRIAFEGLKDSMPIGNLIRFTRLGEQSFAFGDFFQSILKIGHTVIACFKDGIINSISYIRETSLDLVWNTFKICKALKNNQIVNFNAKFINPLMGVGGIAFAINSAFRFNHEREAAVKTMSKPATSDMAKKIKREAKIFCRVIRMAKNICTMAIGIIVSIAAILGFMTPTVISLILGTAILATEIIASIIQETNGLKLK